MSEVPSDQDGQINCTQMAVMIDGFRSRMGGVIKMVNESKPCDTDLKGKRVCVGRERKKAYR